MNIPIDSYVVITHKAQEYLDANAPIGRSKPRLTLEGQAIAWGCQEAVKRLEERMLSRIRDMNTTQPNQCE